MIRIHSVQHHWIVTIDGVERHCEPFDVNGFAKCLIVALEQQIMRNLDIEIDVNGEITRIPLNRG